MSLTDADRRTAPKPAPRRFAWARAWVAGEDGATQRMAGMAFAIRVAAAGVVFLSQIVLARWMGSVEFGIYVSVWTWLLLAGDTVHLSLPMTAQRFIPEYTHRNDFD